LRRFTADANTKSESDFGRDALAHTDATMRGGSYQHLNRGFDRWRRQYGSI
jgi:hypothetical protein